MSPSLLVLLELDPNVVRPGWTPLLILIALGVVVWLLFRSMKKQFRRVHANFPEEPSVAERAVADPPAGAPDTPTAPAVEPRG